MKKIDNYAKIQSFITIIKEKYKTLLCNYFESAINAYDYISDNAMFYEYIGNTFFLYKKMHDYYKIYFFTPSYDMLKEDLQHISLTQDVVVCDLYGRNLSTEYDIFADTGFCEYGRLYHYIKKNTEPYCRQQLPSFIRYADLGDASVIWDIICKNFNKYLDINIHYNYFKRILASGNSLVLELNDEIAGFYILDINKGKAYSYYSFVKKQYRNSLFSLTLLTTAIESFNESKFISGYIRNDNDYVIDFAKMDGYIPDGVELIVLIKNNNNLINIPAVNKMNF